jgi:tetratricopeptide (TPR) repeat protein
LFEQALKIDPNESEALAKSWYLFEAHRWDEAIRAADAGLAINPNSARLFGQRGWPQVRLGRFEQAKSDFRQAMRLSPRDPHIGEWHVGLGNVELGFGHFDAAIEEFHKADDTACCGPTAPFSLAAAYALQGKMDEAKSALAEARRLDPRITIKWLTEIYTPGPPPVYEGLRKAGLPEE